MEQFLKMTDEELRGMIAFNAGEEVNDPFALSVLRFGPHRSIEDIEDVDDFAEVQLEDLTDISDVEKIYDDDYIDHDNLET
jgi:hypothetical protein